MLHKHVITALRTNKKFIMKTRSVCCILHFLLFLLNKNIITITMTQEADIKNAIDVMRNGGVILYPTDTVWGIGCDATNEKAVAKVYKKT